jgi:multiple sugar transport system substrate-binding protein
MRPRETARRLLGLTAGLTVAVVTVAGCNGTSQGGSTQGQGGKGAAQGAIDYAWWGGASRNEKTNAVISLYKKAHPKVKVDGQSSDFDAYWEKLNVEAAGKNLPCVPQMQARELNDYTKRHTLMPLDKMVKSGAIDVSGIPKNVLDTGRGTDGKLYMIPYGAAYDGIMYNKTIVAKAGLPTPPTNFTWDWYTNWLTQAKAKLPKGVAASNLDGGNADVFISYTQSQGASLFKGDKLGFSKSMLAEYWNMWEKLRKSGATISAAAQADQGTDTPLEQSFMALGKVMSATTPGNALEDAQNAINGVKGGKLAITTHPFGSSGLGNVLITSGLSISANCENVPTAASFINFFTNDAKGAHAFSSDNGAVTVTKLLDAQINDPKTTPEKKEELEVYNEIVDHKAPVIVYPSGYTSVFVDAYTRAYQDISFGRKTVAQAVDSFFKEADADLQQG